MRTSARLGPISARLGGRIHNSARPGSKEARRTEGRDGQRNVPSYIRKGKVVSVNPLKGTVMVDYGEGGVKEVALSGGKGPEED